MERNVKAVMSREIILHGRGAIPGIAEGEAIVCPDSIAGNSGALGDID